MDLNELIWLAECHFTRGRVSAYLVTTYLPAMLVGPEDL